MRTWSPSAPASAVARAHGPGVPLCSCCGRWSSMASGPTKPRWAPWSAPVKGEKGGAELRWAKKKGLRSCFFLRFDHQTWWCNCSGIWGCSWFTTNQLEIVLPCFIWNTAQKPWFSRWNMMKSHLWDSGAMYTADTLRENGGGVLSGVLMRSETRRQLSSLVVTGDYSESAPPCPKHSNPRLDSSMACAGPIHAQVMQMYIQKWNRIAL